MQEIPEMDLESYKEARQEAIDEKVWAEKFIKSDDWKKLAQYITENLPTASPYKMENISEVKQQGELIKGMMFSEKLLLDLIQKGRDAALEEIENPEAE